MSTGILIGLIGAAGCGKTSVADRLTQRFGFGQLSFADPLKNMVADQFGWDRADLDDLEFKETPQSVGKIEVTPREMLQYLGTEVFRQINPNHWVEKAERDMPTVHGAAKGIVFPDVRFLNEVEMITRNGGVVVRVVKTDGPGTAASGHISETELAGYVPDYEIGAAHGQLESLYAQAHEVVEAVRETGGPRAGTATEVAGS